MKILITGANSQLAQTIKHSTYVNTHELIFATRQELDITDPNAVSQTIAAQKPQAIINCAGYTNVPQAEIEKEAAHKANVDAVVNLARAAKAGDALLVHISTD